MRAQVLAALEESLAAIPDPADVWSGVQAGIDRRHRRNRYCRTGLAIALVLAVSLLAASISAQPRVYLPIGNPVGEWKNTIHPAWLPDGFVAQEFMATLAGEKITYHARDFNLTILVSDADPARPASSESLQQTEIDGRPAREYTSPGLTMLIFRLPSGRWAQVTLSSSDSNVADAAVREQALQVARSLEDSGDLRLRTAFAPDYLPPGQRVIGVESNIFTPPGFGTVVCASGSEPRISQGTGLSIAVTNVAINKDLDSTARIADIQGRPAYRSITGATVYVADFHGGTLEVHATMEGGLVFPRDQEPPPGIVPLDELIKVAEGVHWVG